MAPQVGVEQWLIAEIHEKQREVRRNGDVGVTQGPFLAENRFELQHRFGSGVLDVGRILDIGRE